MEFVCPGTDDIARLRHTAPTPVPDDCDIKFILYNTVNTDYLFLTFDTATRSIGIKFEHTDQIEIWDGVQWVSHTGIPWEGSIIEWTLEERSGLLSVKRAISYVVVDQAHGTESTNPGRLTILSWHRSTTKYDYLSIEQK